MEQERECVCVHARVYSDTQRWPDEGGRRSACGSQSRGRWCLCRPLNRLFRCTKNAAALFHNGGAQPNALLCETRASERKRERVYAVRRQKTNCASALLSLHVLRRGTNTKGLTERRRRFSARALFDSRQQESRAAPLLYIHHPVVSTDPGPPAAVDFERSASPVWCGTHATPPACIQAPRAYAAAYAGLAVPLHLENLPALPLGASLQLGLVGDKAGLDADKLLVLEQQTGQRPHA